MHKPVVDEVKSHDTDFKLGHSYFVKDVDELSDIPENTTKLKLLSIKDYRLPRISNLYSLQLQNSTLPTNIGEITSLRELECIPLYELNKDIIKLTNLTKLYLSGTNGLIKQFKDIEIIRNFRNLTKLNISNIKFSLDLLSEMTNLEELTLDRNNIHIIPSTFSNLKSLKKFKITDNSLLCILPMDMKIPTIIMEKNNKEIRFRNVREANMYIITTLRIRKDIDDNAYSTIVKCMLPQIKKYGKYFGKEMRIALYQLLFEKAINITRLLIGIIPMLELAILIDNKDSIKKLLKKWEVLYKKRKISQESYIYYKNKLTKAL